jgi:hypothetical protein
MIKLTQEQRKIANIIHDRAVDDPDYLEEIIFELVFLRDEYRELLQGLITGHLPEGYLPLEEIKNSLKEE